MLKKLLNIFQKLSEIISNTSDYEAMLTKFVKVFAEGIDVDVCSIYLYDKKNDMLVLRASHGLNPESVDNVFMKPSEGLTGLCFTSEKMINIINPDRHPQFKYFVNTGEEKYRSYLGVPIIAGKEKLGVIAVQSLQPKKIRKPVADSVNTISSQLANVIVDATVISTLSSNILVRKSGTKAANPLGEMITIKGKAANIGIGIGKACIFDNENSFEGILHTQTDNREGDLKLLEKAIRITKSKTLTLEQKALNLISEADASIFCAHLLFLEDKYLINKIKEEITQNGHTAEYSIKLAFEEYRERFSAIEDSVFREKIMDLKDVMLRLLNVVRNLKSGTPTDENILELNSSRIILVVKEILPSDFIRLPVDDICGIVCEKGGVIDHVAVLAKALNIPAVRGVRNITKLVRNNDAIIVDGHSELVYIRPDNDVINNFKNILKSQRDEHEELNRDFTSCTKDGCRLTLKANIALISEISLLKKYGAEGIGLYRTEFLYMIRDHEPTEEDLINIFKKVFEKAGSCDITIRVLDIGGDKKVPYLNAGKEDNPALGNRGIRFLLSNRALFKTQLRAILRAGVNGNLKLLFPMVSNLHEIDRIYEILNDIETELQFQNYDYAEYYQVGIMVEVPSLLFETKPILEKVDFISLGTNDLVQYLFASDRTNESVYNKNLYLTPLFLKILKNLAGVTCEFKGKKISICGEMACDIYALPLLVGAGITDLSMAPRFIPRIRKIIKQLSYEECTGILDKCIELSSPDEVYKYVEEFYKKNRI
ncbi:MAG: phosphoenolpyruvate--protein phosphotransferase [Victivallales bacterium]|nr:phosphoenolpyruvate--protein phosphotransferase [Victivallales bacterium]MCF7889279.1 phosphoenolpyruvate--protein phosphotransferase [Victivallales bacterium]